MTKTTKIPEALLAAYRETLFEVDAPGGSFTLRIGRHAPALARLCERERCDCAAYLTAFNPRSESQTAAENRAAQAQLERRLAEAGYRTLPGNGHDAAGKWPSEASVLVLGIGRVQAEEFGREFGQNAVVWCGSDAVPELLVLR